MSWQYVTFDCALDLGLERCFGGRTIVRVEVEYDPDDLEPNDICVYIPCRHDPKCMEHTLVIDSLMTDETWKEIDPLIYAEIRQHRTAVMCERRGILS